MYHSLSIVPVGAVPHLGAMALQRAVYRPRDAEHTVLHQVVAEHLEAFLRAVAEAGDGAGLPQFVEREFREFLTCGVFEHGAARLRCEGCAREHLVPFSCKGRAWCPSCGGRRMTERAAHLVDAVLPQVPVRQWVLTVPYRLRYQMAWNHGLSRAVLRVFTRVLLNVYARGARACGVPGGRTGSVTVLQRAGSGLNVNLHFHTLVLDGVFTEAPGGALAFRPAPAPTDAEVAAALATIRHRVQRLLVRRAGRGRRTWKGSISTPTCGCRQTIGRGWSVCVATSCVRPSSWSSRGRGTTARGSWCSSRWSSWSGWRR